MTDVVLEGRLRTDVSSRLVVMAAEDAIDCFASFFIENLFADTASHVLDFYFAVRWESNGTFTAFPVGG